MILNTALVKHLAYPLHERAVKRPTFSYLGELEESQWLERSALEALQLRKLCELLRLAVAHCPWHAERIARAGLDTARLAGSLDMADLRRLPLMDKADATANRERIVWRGVPGGAHRYTTGGSSGTPLIFYFGRWRQASDTRYSGVVMYCGSTARTWAWRAASRRASPRGAVILRCSSCSSVSSDARVLLPASWSW